MNANDYDNYMNMETNRDRKAEEAQVSLEAKQEIELDDMFQGGELDEEFKSLNFNFNTRRDIGDLIYEEFGQDIEFIQTLAFGSDEHLLQLRKELQEKCKDIARDGL